MSVGIFGYVGGSVQGLYQNVSTTGSAVIVAGDAGSVVRIPLLIITALAGTPTLVVDIYNGTSTFILRASAAMTASTSVIYDQGLILPVGSFLRVTVSAAVDIVGATSIAGAPQG